MSRSNKEIFANRIYTFVEVFAKIFCENKKVTCCVNHKHLIEKKLNAPGVSFLDKFDKELNFLKSFILPLLESNFMNFSKLLILPSFPCFQKYLLNMLKDYLLNLTPGALKKTKAFLQSSKIEEVLIFCCDSMSIDNKHICLEIIFILSLDTEEIVELLGRVLYPLRKVASNTFENEIFDELNEDAEENLIIDEPNSDQLNLK